MTRWIFPRACPALILPGTFCSPRLLLSAPSWRTTQISDSGTETCFTGYSRSRRKHFCGGHQMGKEECLKQGQNHQRPAYKIASWSRMRQKTQRSREIQDDERKARSALQQQLQRPLIGVARRSQFWDALLFAHSLRAVSCWMHLILLAACSYWLLVFLYLCFHWKPLMELHDCEAQVHAPTPELGPSPQKEEGMGEKKQPLHFTPLTFQ